MPDRQNALTTLDAGTLHRRFDAASPGAPEQILWLAVCIRRFGGRKSELLRFGKLAIHRSHHVFATILKHFSGLGTVTEDVKLVG